jgi:microcystin-dependent protein
MKTNKGITIRNSSNKNINFTPSATTNPAMLYIKDTTISSIEASGNKHVFGTDGADAKLYDIVDNVSESGEGLPTEDAVSKYVKQIILNTVCRVGNIIITTTSDNPSTYLGGTWVAWGSGKVPVGVNTSDTDFATVEQTGGEKTHTLTVDELAKHEHSGTSSSTSTEGYTKPIGTSPTLIGYTGTITHTVKIETVNNTSSKTYYIDGRIPGGVTTNITQKYAVKAGKGMSHNNLQPYITCYMWKRTA